MFAFQTINTKRRRDDDSDSEDERYFKKSRQWSLQQTYASPTCLSQSGLALRPSPSPPRVVPGLGAMTPAQSEHSEANSPASDQEDPLVFSSPHNDMDYAMQMDDDDDQFDVISSQAPDSPFIATNFRPAKLNADLFSRDIPVNSTSRMPTPIYPTFHNSGMSGLGYPSSGMAGGMSMGSGFFGTSSYNNPPRMQPPPRKQKHQVHPDRMPSPISEDEDVPDTPTALTQSQLSRLSVTTHFSSSMDADMAPPAVPPTPTRGRKRSGALTGMGRFSMGYRDDCEKCRLRVPGHYSHFLP